MGRAIWKNPMDCWVYQEILYETQPEVVVELGIAYGGNLLYLSDLFTLMGKTDARLVGVDIDTSRAADLNVRGLHLIQGSCQDQRVVQEVASLTQGRRTMVIADCDHSGDHVLAELSRYSPLVSVGCYYVVEDGICDVMGWNPTTGAALGNSTVPGPRTAALEFISGNPKFVNDAALREKYLLTYNFDGFLRRVR
jgi:cephalosporin hydroxylase